MSVVVKLPTAYFPDPDVGRPVALGSVYIGTIDTDPTVESNRITVTLLQEDGTEVAIPAASQPISLNAGGVFTYQGSVVQVLVDGNYSMTVLDANSVQQYYFPNSNSIGGSGSTFLYTSGASDSLAVSATGLSAGGVVTSQHFDSNLTADSGATFQATGTTTAGKAGNCPDADGYFYDADGVQFQKVGNLDVRAFGAVGDGSTDSLSALTSAIAAAIVLDQPITGYGIFVISDQLDISSANVDMPEGVFKLQDSFPVTTDNVGIEVGSNSGGPGAVRNLFFKVDGNKDNQSNATISVRLNDMNAPLGNVNIRGIDSYTLLQANGNTEKLYGQVHGYNCGLILHDKNDATVTTDTPDENYWLIHGNLCDQWYKQEGGASSYVHFACENSSDATLYGVEILGNKASILSGEIRGSSGGAILIDGGTSLDVLFSNLELIQVNDLIAVNINACRTVNGFFTARNVNGDEVLAIKDVSGTGDLQAIITDVALSSASNYAVHLGDGTDTLSRFSLRVSLFAISTGKGVYHERTSEVDVFVTDCDVEYEFGANSRGDSVSLPRGFLTSNITLTSAAPQEPSIVFRGSVNTTDLAAFSGSVEGMRAINVRAYDNTEARYVQGGWVPVLRITEETAANIADSSATINTAGKFSSKLVWDTTNNIIYFASGPGATAAWYVVDGSASVTPS